MGHTIVIRILEVGLFVGILLHIVQDLLRFQNRSKRQKGYQVPMGNKGSKWYSRSMGLLGTLILLFLIMHISHFWIFTYHTIWLRLISTAANTRTCICVW